MYFCRNVSEFLVYIVSLNGVYRARSHRDVTSKKVSHLLSLLIPLYLPFSPNRYAQTCDHISSSLTYKNQA